MAKRALGKDWLYKAMFPFVIINIKTKVLFFLPLAKDDLAVDLTPSQIPGVGVGRFLL